MIVLLACLCSQETYLKHFFDFQFLFELNLLTNCSYGTFFNYFCFIFSEEKLFIVICRIKKKIKKDKEKKI